MKPFYVGLTMAGAISAGAYTAGAFDFLMQALEEWEKRKRDLTAAGTARETWDVPSHSVVIPVMSGASAGGITGALGVIALAEELAPGAVPKPIPIDKVGTVTTYLPRLYQAWVQMPRFVDPAGGPDLLGTTDLEDGPVRSLLDTTLLSRIVDASLLGIKKIAPPRSYLAKTLHIFLTHSNMRGVPYEISFTGGNDGQPGYPMMCHADRVHYAVSGIGGDAFHSKWAAPELPPQLDVSTLTTLTEVKDRWQGFAEAALGTGAFPVGLRAREIRGATVGAYGNRQWPIDLRVQDPAAGAAFHVTPAFPKPFGDDVRQSTDYVAVDGGLIDNEPFELARWALMDEPPHRNPRDVAKCDRAVIMVDPFPEPPAYDIGGTLDSSIVATIKKLIPTLKNQARFKLNDLADALDETVASRYLIAPRRRAGPGAPIEPFAIACGLLGGFGGFLSEAFRAHDYQLGRLNCYLFLKDNMALPLLNGVLAAGYHAAAQQQEYLAENRDPADQTKNYQIIPLVGSAAKMPEPPRWPRVQRQDVEDMIARVKQRAAALFTKVNAEQISSRIGRLVARVVWSSYGKSKVEDYVRWVVLKDLVLRDQIEKPFAGEAEKPVAGASYEERKVLAALANPAYDFRTIEGIAKEYLLDAAFISRTLGEYRKLIYQGAKTDRNAPTYALRERKPGWFSQLPGVKQLDAWVFSGPPVVG
jgi:hypothetical protein